jgi:hypothetical protein
MKSHGMSFASPGGSADRTSAVRSCPARPRRSGRCRSRRAHRRASRACRSTFHRELLQVGGKALQVLIVRQHGDGLDSRRNRIPDRQQPQKHRQIALHGASGSARPSRESPRASRGSAGGQSRSSSRARWPSPSSSDRRPSPRSRTCWPCRCRTWPRLVGVRRDGDEVPRNRRFIVQPSPATTSARMALRHRLEGRERLRGDDEERLGRVEVEQSLRRSRCRRYSTRSGT